MTEKILFIDTERQSVRAEAFGWSCDDSATVTSQSACPTLSTFFIRMIVYFVP